MSSTQEQINKAIENLNFTQDDDFNPFENKIVVNAVMLFKVVEFDEDGDAETYLAIISDDSTDFLIRRGLLEEAIDYFKS